MKALVMSLATARLTQLVVDDEITSPIRESVAARAERPGSKAAWGAVDVVINCHACTSVWAGAGILAAEQIPFGRFLVRVLALSQAALAVKSVIERIDR
jgi:hypothetical protein